MRTCFLYVLKMIENVCQLSIIKKKPRSNRSIINQLSFCDSQKRENNQTRMKRPSYP